MRERRFVRVPWFNTDRWNEKADLVPQGEAETVVFLPNREHIEGLHILGLETDLMLGIKTSEFGDPISCAITVDVDLDIVPAHSNPRRRIDDKDDGA